MSPKESIKNDRVVELIKSGVESLGVRGLARAVGISPAIITRYMQGKVGEPSQATLEKLAYYFKTSVFWLRGSPWATKDGGVDLTFGYFDPEMEKEIDRIVGVNTDEHREQQIRYILQAARMASDEELKALVVKAQNIVSTHLGE